jgi:cytochrome c oxidase assembly protein subunit 15
MKYSNAVRYWLFFGLFLVFMQIVIGGITRLTGSGLSITEWDIVFGTFPPFGEEDWINEFNKYQMTPQYQKINQGMSMSEFKFIYFWEYFHRLWARMMGFAFIIPFVVFWLFGMVDKTISKKLSVVILFAGLAAIFGWIMVASGLIERPWVNAYKLSIHLSIGISVFLSLLWVILSSFYQDGWKRVFVSTSIWKKAFLFLFVLLCIQIVFGGIVSGMRAALTFATWPDMNGALIPDVLLNSVNWKFQNLIEYDKSVFAPALAQFIHRNLAYAITILSSVLFYRFLKDGSHSEFRSLVFAFCSLLLVQVVLGILTLMNSIGNIPVGLGVMHQGVGVLLLGSLFILLYAYSTSLKHDGDII